MSEEKDHSPETEAEEAQSTERTPEPAEQIAALQDQLLRLQAETENNRKRLDRELERQRQSAVEAFAKDLLAVLDDIRRAQTSWAEKKLDASVQEGLNLILTSANQMLARHNIHPMGASGATFDPNHHEALFEDTQSSAKSGTITQIIQEGYLCGDKLLRPARVAVAKNPETLPPPPQKD